MTGSVFSCQNEFESIGDLLCTYIPLRRHMLTVDQAIRPRNDSIEIPHCLSM